jgi:arylsulfatase A-like enzyme
VDVLTGEEVADPRTFTIMHSRRARSFIDGDWKLIDFSYRRSPVDSVELFNLREDPNESTDLSEAEPERLNAMRNKLKEISEGDLR